MLLINSSIYRCHNDHSIYTTRLWAIHESKTIANSWNVKAFFAVTHGDIVNCLNQLDNLKLADHTAEIEKGNLGVHVQVCSLMRAKLVSEIRANLQKLKDTPKECVHGLASVCKTIALANLQMIFPPNRYWKQIMTDVLPEKPSLFVDKYLDQILVPVLEATEDPLITNMTLTLICEAWLDHIYTNKIKFSHFGARQLLTDFGYITKWLADYPTVSESMRKKLLKNEILKRCEGVGRLLLRKPGERIKMTEKNKRRSSDSSDREKSELMPAEMYVPNQEQWLELRVMKQKNIFTTLMCCEEP
ncbi:unnamed protein product [Phaedon cochleariae]|uniref:Coiled-coil protein 142 C-terminal domain-containing protein n=1 Tax=Phaedon cochleariae TaxID=80249 RepID=A0A9P0DL58_PHACE|nr:unnamed protein product [Phaedon cochleariae]